VAAGRTRASAARRCRLATRIERQHVARIAYAGEITRKALKIRAAWQTALRKWREVTSHREQNDVRDSDASMNGRGVAYGAIDSACWRQTISETPQQRIATASAYARASEMVGACGDSDIRRTGQRRTLRCAHGDARGSIVAATRRSMRSICCGRWLADAACRRARRRRINDQRAVRGAGVATAKGDWRGTRACVARRRQRNEHGRVACVRRQEHISSGILTSGIASVAGVTTWRLRRVALARRVAGIIGWRRRRVRHSSSSGGMAAICVATWRINANRAWRHHLAAYERVCCRGVTYR